jgi:hypothetical protein
MRNYKKHEDLPIKKKNSKNNSHRQKQNMVTDTTTNKFISFFALVAP